MPVFVARGGAGIRAADCASSATTCSTDDFWKLKLSATFARVQPDAVVTELGINDAGKVGTATGRGYASYDTKIDWFMRLMPAHTQVFWTNLPCAIEPPTAQRGCLIINQDLSQAKQRWSNLTVVNWAKVANLHPGWMRFAGSIYGVHYTSAGYTAWTTLVLESLDAAFPSPG